MKNRFNAVSILLLILISAGVYWNTLPNEFVAGDRQFILRNEHIGDAGTVVSAFTADYWGKLGGEPFVYYRPLVILAHFIDFQLYGLNPAGHHLTNIILHAIVTVTVYFFFLTFLSGNQWPALTGAALFAVHPIHTHSVSYVMGRTDILAAVFYLWGMILLMNIRGQIERHLRIAMLLGACLCYLLSLLCKEIAITLPLVIILYRYCWNRKKFSWKEWDFLIPLLFLIGTLALYLTARAAAVGLSTQQVPLPCWYSVGQRVWLVIITFGFYLQKLLFPLHLCYYSNIVIPGDFLEEVVRAPLFWICILWVVTFALCLKHAAQVSFSLGWIGLTLLPVLNIIMLPALAKENYLYLPSIGFCLLFSTIIAEALKHNALKPLSHTRLLYSGTILIGLLYASSTIIRNVDYKDPRTFLESTIKDMAPVAFHHREDPRFFEPVKNFYTTHRNLGILYQQYNQPEKAIIAFASALEYTPPYFSPRYAASVKTYLGILLYKTGRLEEALTILGEARSSAENPAAVDNLLRTILIQLKENNIMVYDKVG